MKQQEYAHSTARLYRQVLRNFARVANTRPTNVTRAHLDRYFSTLGRGHCSAHWTAINISTLRTVFDRVFGLELLGNRSGPRRPWQLPEILNHKEACDLLDAATTLRDRLLIGLLYGCGLTVGETRRLQWLDLDPEKMTVQAPGNLQLRPRTVRLPDALLPLVQAAHTQCPPDALVFPGSPRRSEVKTGAREGHALSVRWIESLIRDCARRAEIMKPVSPKTLRDTYAVHCLQSGANIREVQTLLGHCSVRTTLRYTRCMLPSGAISPLDMGIEIPPRPPAAPPAETIKPAAVNPAPSLLRLATSPAEFFSLLRMQLGQRLFARRQAVRSNSP
jgi:site-specific recombinase XerD